MLNLCHCTITANRGIYVSIKCYFSHPSTTIASCSPLWCRCNTALLSTLQPPIEVHADSLHHPFATPRLHWSWQRTISPPWMYVFWLLYINHPHQVRCRQSTTVVFMTSWFIFCANKDEEDYEYSFQLNGVDSLLPSYSQGDDACGCCLLQYGATVNKKKNKK